MQYYPESPSEGLRMVGKWLGVVLLIAVSVWVGETYLPPDVFGTFAILFYCLILGLSSCPRRQQNSE